MKRTFLFALIVLGRHNSSQPNRFKDLMTSTRKKSAAALATIIFTGLSTIASARPCRKQSVERMVTAVAEAFVEKRLGVLDNNRPHSGSVRIVIEYSLADDDDPQRFEIRKFSSLARAERWLKSREIEDLPGRYSRPALKCAKGVCTYNLDGGINHRSLYLQKNHVRNSRRLSLCQDDLFVGWRLSSGKENAGSAEIQTRRCRALPLLPEPQGCHDTLARSSDVS